MKEDHLPWTLLVRYLAGEATDQERQAINLWLAADPAHATLLCQVQEVWALASPSLVKQPLNVDVYQEWLRNGQLRTNPSVAVNSLSWSKWRNTLSNWLPSPVWELTASVTLVMGIFLVWWYQTQRWVTVETAYAQRHTVHLPDGSRVTLNGHSQLRYPNEQAWQADADRRVELRGEAFFTVRHTGTNQPFLVWTEGGTLVRVLGTEFTVTERQGQTRVVLQSGRVKVKWPTDSDTLTLQPGDLVAYSKTKRHWVRARVNADMYASWRTDRLVFNQTPLSEIVLLLQESYGLSVEVPQRGLLHRTFTGSVPNQDVDLLLIGLSKSFDLAITRHDRTVRIVRRE